MIRLNVPCDYVQGHLRTGHYEVEMSNEDYFDFCTNLSEREQLDFIMSEGKLIVDSYEVDDVSLKDRNHWVLQEDVKNETNKSEL